MAGEFAHIDVGGELTKVEWEGIGTHLLNGQAADDLVYASSTTQLSRLAVASSTIIAKLAAGGLVAATPAEIKTLLAYGTMAAETATNYVPKSLYDAYSILMATDNDTPIAITIGEQTVVGRITSGAIKALTVAELQTLALSAALPVNTSIILPTLATTLADGEWVGITCPGVIGTAAGQIFGDLCYFNPATGEWLLTDADAVATALGTLGICLAAGNENAASTYLLWGRVRADAAFPALTALTTTYMSGTAGDITETAPTGSIGIIRCLGYSVNANELFFQPSTDYYTLKA